MMDELAKFGAFRKGADYAAMNSTFPVTDCRVIVSTPKGTANAYYDCIVEDIDLDSFDVTRNPLSPEIKADLRSKGVAVLHWSNNPIRNRGMYRVQNDGSLQAVDEGEFGPIPEEYKSEWPTIRTNLERRGYRVLDSLRSPWYDNQCLRPGASPQSIAQELDLDFGGSGFTLFTSDILESARRTCRRPQYVMNVDYNQFNLEPDFIEHGGGLLKLWCNLVEGKWTPAKGVRYGVCADIASGLGGSMHSNSVACILNLEDGTQAGEWANNATDPYTFCDICIAIAKFFNEAEIIHEANGPFGKAFTSQLLKRGYSNIFRRREKFKTSEKSTKDYGWGSNQETKADMFMDLARKIKCGMIKVRSKPILDEMRSWVMEGGRIVHAKASSTTDESSKNEAHGDRVIALGVVSTLYDLDTNVDPEVAKERENWDNPHPNTMAYRLKELDQQGVQQVPLDW